MRGSDRGAGGLSKPMSTIKSNIQWTDRTWNPVRGCSLVSPGCTNCYAMKQAHRFSGAGKPFEGLTRMTEHGPVWTGKVRIVPEALNEPLRWRKPQKVFVNSMSDLFHEDVPTDFVDQVFAIMALAKEHTFQILTKRPAEMRRYLESKDPCCLASAAPEKYPCSASYIEDRPWPLPNVWLGVSVENQATADDRIPILLQTPAAVRFLSCEPLLERIDLPMRGIGWVIVGGESGPGARPCNVEWIRDLVRQCRAAVVPPFVKQLGAKPLYDDRRDEVPLCWPRDRKGGDPTEWPEDFRIREYPITK